MAVDELDLRDLFKQFLSHQNSVNQAQISINASDNKRWCAFLDQYDAHVAEFKKQSERLQAFLDVQNAANAVSLRFNEHVRTMFNRANMDTDTVSIRCTVLEAMAFDTSARLERAQERIAQLENETSELRNRAVQAEEINTDLLYRVGALEHLIKDKADKLS